MHQGFSIVSCVYDSYWGTRYVGFIFCVVVVGGYCIALVCSWLGVKMWVGGGMSMPV